MVDGKTLMMACEGHWGKSCDFNSLLQLRLLVFSGEVWSIPSDKIDQFLNDIKLKYLD